MKIDPSLRRFLRIGLIGFGALMVISALVNMTAAWELIAAAEEQSLGITRNEFLGTYGVMLVMGGAIVLVGLRWRE